jgi:O-antigen biosynthesis protein
MTRESNNTPGFVSIALRLLRENNLALSYLFLEALAQSDDRIFQDIGLINLKVVRLRARHMGLELHEDYFFQQQVALCRKHFSSDYYLETNHDVRDAGQNPLEHFVKYGWKEGRNPNPDFDIAFYVKEILRMEKPKINPLVHWITTGCSLKNQSLSIRRSGLIFKKNIPTKGGGNVNKLGAFDVVVPIYNAYDDLVECLHRLNTNTPDSVTVFLIDDASTDTRVIRFLEKFVRTHKNFGLLKNKKNQGFIESVNRGLSIGKNNKIILNTDAMVSKGWFDRITFPFSVDPTIASVTPFSNNAEIANVPTIGVPSDLMENELDFLDRIAAKLDPLSSIHSSPTGVGFCMAISGEWLEKIPNFDSTFGRGYGEEVDWCQKVRALGGRHVLISNLFVEHRGGRSFGAEKQKRVMENNKTISLRYPSYDSEVASFSNRDPAYDARFFLTLARLGFNGKIIVYAAHSWGGGADLWLNDRIRKDRALGFSTLVVRPSRNQNYLRLELQSGKLKRNTEIARESLSEYMEAIPKRHIAYSCLVGVRDPFHILGVMCEGSDKKINLSVYIHDYYSVCKSYNLVSSEGLYCGLPEGKKCGLCFQGLENQITSAEKTIQEWRGRWSSFLERASEIILFSVSSRDLMSRVYPGFAHKFDVRPHELISHPGVVKPHEFKRVIGILGNIGYQKGAKILHDLASCLDGEFSIVLIGNLDPKYKHEKILEHGDYRVEEIASLVKKYSIQAWFIPSIWPETFSYTTHECLATGLNTFVFDLGAQSEALQKVQPEHIVPMGLDAIQIKRFLSDMLVNDSKSDSRTGISNHCNSSMYEF